MGATKDETAIPEWAFNRAKVLAKDEAFDGGYTRTHQAFARYIAEHEEPPVDPILLEARKIVAEHCLLETSKRCVMSGERDSWLSVKAAIDALKRGIEISEEEELLI